MSIGWYIDIIRLECLHPGASQEGEFADVATNEDVSYNAIVLELLSRV